MKILRTYILKETIGPFLLSLGVLTFILLLGNLVRLTEMIITKGVNLFLIGKLFLYLTPALLSYTLPIACLSAVILAFSRLSSDNEIIAIKSGGINILKLIIPLLIIGLILSLALFMLNDKIIPYAHFASRKAVKEIGLKNPAAYLEAGTFIDSFKNYIIYINRIDKDKLYNVRIYQPQGEDRPARTTVAKRGEFIVMPKEGRIKLKLIDGSSDEPDFKDPTKFYKLNFKTYFMTLDLMKSQEGKIAKKPKDMTLRELSKKISELGSISIDVAPLVTEYHRKIAMSFSCFIFILLGCPLGIITRRREKSANFSLAFIVVALYYLLFIGFKALSLEGIFPASISMWSSNIIFGLVGLFLIYKLCES